ncbi:MAG: cyclodeaminase/cyclohydrolase family protein [Caldilinea sp.]|nr:cyclodeaminase/cyclohydrolase family protein [Caldilinea sp.]MDW8440403.1 cyclodeaminase/cyclohydrolase family protein [Caldilineaceae bacterium]
MLIQTRLSANPVFQALERIGEHDHCQAGGAIGLSGALAAALAQATANATRSQQPMDVQDAAAKSMQQTMKRIRQEFLRLADADADALLEFVALEERGEPLAGYALLCEGPRAMADLAVEAAQTMQSFRTHVCERSRDDLEFALTLMSGVARAAIQLLDSNLRIWPLPELLATYEPHIDRLQQALEALQPMTRIRTP